VEARSVRTKDHIHINELFGVAKVNFVGYTFCKINNIVASLHAIVNIVDSRFGSYSRCMRLVLYRAGIGVVVWEAKRPHPPRASVLAAIHCKASQR
jgi:hypothetical protein